MKRRGDFKFATEADLCRAFATCIPDDWTAYNETGGFDILLVHKNGVQIGVEAKLTLNAKVLCQAIAGRSRDNGGPDFRAVLVGKVVAENETLARALGITVIQMEMTSKESRRSRIHYNWQGPEQVVFKLGWNCELPRFEVTSYSEKHHIWLDRERWYDQAPTHRLALPEYVPDVEAGHPSPQTLSRWKIQAMKVCVHALKAGQMNRADFKTLKIDPSRWMTGHWMKKAEIRGFWVPTEYFPATAYQNQHPDIYARIEEEYPVWAVKEGLITPNPKGAVA